MVDGCWPAAGWLALHGVGVHVVGASIMALAQTAVIVPPTHWHLQAAWLGVPISGRNRQTKIANLIFMLSSCERVLSLYSRGMAAKFHFGIFGTTRTIMIMMTKPHVQQRSFDVIFRPGVLRLSTGRLQCIRTAATC